MALPPAECEPPASALPHAPLVRAADPDDELLDLLYEQDSGALRPGVDLAPLTVSTHTKLARISYLLGNLGASHVLVLREGLLHGMLTRVKVFEVEKKLYHLEAVGDQQGEAGGKRGSVVAGMGVAADGGQSSNSSSKSGSPEPRRGGSASS